MQLHHAMSSQQQCDDDMVACVTSTPCAYSEDP